MPQGKLKGPRLFADVPMTRKNGSQMSYKEAVNSPDLSSIMSGKSNAQVFGEQAQDDVRRKNAKYKSDPVARKQAIARAAAASKANAPKAKGQSKTAALQREMARGTEKARERNDLEKLPYDSDRRHLQWEMGDATIAAQDRSAREREKSPASIQIGMAASTRKTQAASAAAKKSAPAPSMRKLLKIK
jgi:hypothetical protein